MQRHVAVGGVLRRLCVSSLGAATAVRSMASASVLSVERASFPVTPADPFLFLAYHQDYYPGGKAESMEAPHRGNGADFDQTRPYRMYHGDTVPGFPQHPHRGFETITVVLNGTCDHTDSLGGAGRYGGNGKYADVQWMTAARGIVHGEMFPLRNVAPMTNTLQLFQIWLNLPRASKMAPPTYVMTWAEQMKVLQGTGGAECQLAAGSLGNETASVAPPPHSWGADPAHDVGVFVMSIPPGGSFTLPPAKSGAQASRSAYLVEGPKDKENAERVTIGGVAAPGGRGIFKLRSDVETICANAAAAGTEQAVVLVLQGVPIKEPVAQHGPFIMSTRAEIDQAFADYRSTRFGGWPWEQDAVVFPREQGRFADVIVDGQKVRSYPPGAESTSGKPKGELR